MNTPVRHPTRESAFKAAAEVIDAINASRAARAAEASPRDKRSA